MIRNSIYILLVMLCAVSCSEECDVSQQDTYLSANQRAWIPFNGTENVTFEDGNGNEIVFTAAGYQNFGPVINEDECADPYSEVVNLSFSSSQVDYEIRYTLRFWNGSGIENKLGLEFELLDDAANLTSSIEYYTPYPDIENASPSHNSKAINSNTYTNVFEFTGHYMTLLYNKQYGVVGLIEGSCCDQQNLKTWNLKI